MTRLLPRLALLFTFTSFALAVHADVIFQQGTVSQPDEQMIDFVVGSSGNSINGWTSVTSSPVVVASEKDPLKVYMHGSNFGIQTAHGGSDPDTSVNDITITQTGGTFADLLGSIYGVFAQEPVVNFSVWTTDSTTPWTWSFTGVTGSVDNFFTIYTANGEKISKVLITGKFFEIRDLYLSGVPGSGATPAPEPASLALLGSGLFGAICIMRRKS